MLEDFIRGIGYSFSGCKAFYGNRRAWKYALAPIGSLVVLYCILSLSGHYGASALIERLRGWGGTLPDWLSWLTIGSRLILHILTWFLVQLVFCTTVCTFYEMFGGFLFDALVEFYEKEHYGMVPPPFSLCRTIGDGIDAIWFGCKTLISLGFLLILGMIFPVAGQILLVLVMGYYQGLSYMITPANNARKRIPALRRSLKGKRCLVLGFGVSLYLLLLFIPFSIFIVLPGMVLGGTQLYHDCCEQQGQGSRPLV